MSKVTRWVLTLGLVVAAVLGGPGTATADEPALPGTIVGTVLGPGVCC